MDDLRPYRLDLVFGRRDRIYDDPNVREFIGDHLRSGVFYDFVKAVSAHITEEVPKELIEDSLQYLVGSKLTDKELECLAWRLAGNIRKLKNLKPILPWASQTRPEWVPVQVIENRVYKNRFGKVGNLVKVLALAGSICPMEMTRFWSNGFCRVLSSRLGFSKPWGAHPYENIHQLFNMRMYVLVEAKACNEDSPGFIQVHEKQPSHVITWNKQLLKWRSREGTDFRCFKNYPKRHKCFKCHIGFDQCPAATHDRTFVRQPCQHCGKDVWHDPEDMLMCVDCRTIQTLKRNTSSV